jgi:hypothetical protein
MSNNEKVLLLSARIINLRNELKAAEAELSSFMGGNASRAKPQMRSKPAGRGTGPSISQRVLNMVKDAGRAGIATRDIVSIIPNKDAVHSALQAHRTSGKIENDGGVWVVTQKYAEELSAPVAIPQIDTRPLRPHPAGGEYLGQ